MPSSSTSASSHSKNDPTSDESPSSSDRHQHLIPRLPYRGPPGRHGVEDEEFDVDVADYPSSPFSSSDDEGRAGTKKKKDKGKGKGKHHSSSSSRGKKHSSSSKGHASSSKHHASSKHHSSSSKKHSSSSRKDKDDGEEERGERSDKEEKKETWEGVKVHKSGAGGLEVRAKKGASGLGKWLLS